MRAIKRVMIPQEIVRQSMHFGFRTEGVLVANAQIRIDFIPASLTIEVKSKDKHWVLPALGCSWEWLDGPTKPGPKKATMK